MHSCLYVGQVRHRRFSPSAHGFSFPLFMLYLDLSELDDVFRDYWFWSTRKPALAWFKRSDYLGDPSVSLAQAVGDAVLAHSGKKPQGPIRMLTHLRYFGYCFNPVTFYYCFDKAGEHVEAIIAEITNTPWGERHHYVLTEPDQSEQARVQRFQFAKDFHVSPFFPMDLDYDWRFARPGQRLSVHMNLIRDRRKVFDATLRLEREEINGLSLAWVLIRYPLLTLQVVTAIYAHAAWLKLKGTPFFAHPAHQPPPVTEPKPHDNSRPPV